MVKLGRRILSWKKDERNQALALARPIFRSSHFDIRIAPKQTLIGRLFVVTPKKIGCAPYRNLLKRRARSIFYEKKFYDSPYDWLIFFRPSTAPLPYKTLHDTLVSLLQPHC